jgi:cytochrome P450
VWNVTDEIHRASFDEGSYNQDPVAFFARLRESRLVAPVRMPEGGRSWIVTRHADVRTALTDPRLAKDVHRWPGGGRARSAQRQLSAGATCVRMLSMTCAL